jgi:DNA-directed RNA polymerase subunit RPC12/RpoP
MDLGGISLKRVIDCPHCGHSNMIDLEDYETSSSSTERPMGPDVLHEFDCDDYECAGCGKPFRITGYISEYPLGAYEHEEINVEAIQTEEELM